LANACNQPGMVEVGTNVLLPNERGSTSRNMTPCTAPDVRTFMPTHTEIQQKHSANAIDRLMAATADSASVSTRKPIT
jgi:hypothetical protein